MSQVYSINKAINRPIVFKGLKAQYIWWLGIGLAVLLLLFTLLYIAGVSILFCLLLVFGVGGILFRLVYRYSRKYGEYGLLKTIAAKSIPRIIKCDCVLP
jgi:hypothetical protein